MAYSDFTIEEVKARFKLKFEERQDLFSSVPAIKISPMLRDTLAENTPLALAMNTEKARSELMIAPILLEVRRRAGEEVSLFSGADFNVDPEKGLKGTCDFLLSRSREQLTIEAPLIAVVEAKNENMKGGIGQCVAEMVAAALFNERKGSPLPAVFGAVTTGNNWKFLRLSGTTASIDLAEYHIKEVDRIVAILTGILLGTAG